MSRALTSTTTYPINQILKTISNFFKCKLNCFSYGCSVFFLVMGPLLRTADQGADTLVWLAAADTPLESNGLFWLDRRARSTHKLPSTKRSDTPEQRQRLWSWVSETCGIEPTVLDSVGP